MGIKKILGIVALVGGIVLLLLSVLADLIGIGGGGFGIKQIVGVVVGLVAAVLGIVLMRMK